MICCNTTDLNIYEPASRGNTAVKVVDVISSITRSPIEIILLFHKARNEG